MPIACSRCRQTKDESEFYPNIKTKTGYQSWCRNCYRMWNKSYRVGETGRELKTVRYIRIIFPDYWVAKHKSNPLADWIDVSLPQGEKLRESVLSGKVELTTLVRPGNTATCLVLTKNCMLRFAELSKRPSALAETYGVPASMWSLSRRVYADDAAFLGKIACHGRELYIAAMKEKSRIAVLAMCTAYDPVRLRALIEDGLNFSDLQRELGLTARKLTALLKHFDLHIQTGKIKRKKLMFRSTEKRLLRLEPLFPGITDGLALHYRNGKYAEIFQSLYRAFLLNLENNWEIRRLAILISQGGKRQTFSQDPNISWSLNQVEATLAILLLELGVPHARSYKLNGCRFDFAFEQDKALIELDGSIHDPEKSGRSAALIQIKAKNQEEAAAKDGWSLRRIKVGDGQSFRPDDARSILLDILPLIPKSVASRDKASCGWRKQFLPPQWDVSALTEEKTKRNIRCPSSADTFQISYGWTWGANGQVVENTKEQKVIQAICTWYEAGVRESGITAELNAQGISAKPSKLGTKWASGAVDRLLRKAGVWRPRGHGSKFRVPENLKHCVLLGTESVVK